ncbi:MAG: SPFH domain-containing protein [Clostridiales Family XIII bacterium]|nr:SPFH domain-containing protein [Clostridiales Family XIII bacterium]
MVVLVLLCLLSLLAIAAVIFGAVKLERGDEGAMGVILLVVGIVWFCVPFPLLCAGLKILKPNEAYVFTLFGKYYGSLKGEGFYFVHPFVVATNPLKAGLLDSVGGSAVSIQTHSGTDDRSGKKTISKASNKISLKAMTLNNNKQKINDLLGNPIEIGIVVIWRVINTAKAAFNVENYEDFLSIQCDSALRNIVRLYPYDVPGDENETSLRGSSREIASKLQSAIQEKADAAGLEVVEARITHLAYSPEIAAAMLQRQQASAIVDARSLIVKGAVSMVEQALRELNENNIVDLDEERKAAMVSNLLVVLCGNKDAQPIVNSGSLY